MKKIVQLFPKFNIEFFLLLFNILVPICFFILFSTLDFLELFIVTGVVIFIFL